MADWTCDELRTAAGKSRIREFLNRLEREDFIEAAALIKVLQVRGNQMREPRSKALGGNLFELRGNQVRIFYTFRPGRRIVLLDGIVKKRTKVPVAELERIRKLNREVS